MSHPDLHHKITYIEFTTTDIERTRQFYSTVFGWNFKDWGPEYIEILDAGVNGGFAKGDPLMAPCKTAPVVVLFSTDLMATEEAVVAAGGTVVTPTFEFPGGRRFHFSDGAGNVLGVWAK